MRLETAQYVDEEVEQLVVRVGHGPQRLGDFGHGGLPFLAPRLNLVDHFVVRGYNKLEQAGLHPAEFHPADLPSDGSEGSALLVPLAGLDP
jgi:hypothetical protein